MWVGAAVLGIGALIAVALPFSTRDAAASPPPPKPLPSPERALRSAIDHGHHPKTPPACPAAERREALIDAAVHEFAHGGIHGTPVDRIARRVGVAQPYVFSLFASEQELFLAP